MEFILATFLGIALGIISGIMPGLGTTSILLTCYTIVASMEPFHAMMCYLALIISGQYVASLTAIYTGVPGSESSFPAAKESGRLIRLGLTQTAVAQNAIASMIGNGVGLLMLMLLIPMAMKIMAAFGAGLQLGIVVICIVVVILSTAEKITAFVSVLLAFGLMYLGPNPHTFATVNLGLSFLDNGLSWVSLTMAAIIGHAVHSLRGFKRIKIDHSDIMGVKLGIDSLKSKWGSLGRGAVLGFFIGLVPGLSYILSSTICYQIEQKVSDRKGLSEKDKVLSSLMSSDAAHCSGTIAMLLPLLAFGIPITSGEGVIYNIITMSMSTKELLGVLYDNWLYVSLAILFVNVFSMWCAWKLGSKLVSALMMPRIYLMLLIVIIGLSVIIYLASLTGTIVLSIATFIVIGLLFFFSRMNPLPFIFGVLIFNLLETLVFSVSQLYF
jgi:putative tricarboxylic transport membrane protein